jgi:hypothetical protein
MTFSAWRHGMRCKHKTGKKRFTIKGGNRGMLPETIPQWVHSEKVLPVTVPQYIHGTTLVMKKA